MVTRTVIRITSSEAAAFAATSTLSSSADSSIITAPAEQNDTEELQTNLKLCNHPSCTKRAQHPSLLCWQHGAKESICSYSGCHNKGILLGLCADHGGLVQLCRQKGCINEVDFERRGGLCYIHQTGDQSDSEDSEEDGEIHLCSFRGCISSATTYEGLCDGHAAHADEYCLDEVGKKRDRPSENSIRGKDIMKRQRVDVDFNLTDVPPQPPIPKSGGYIKEGASKYAGVTFNKQKNKWQAQLSIYGKGRQIGCYENEEEAAIDYARAVFKYKGQGALDKARDQKSFIIDLSDVPPQPPIPKSAGRVRDGASKYKGVSFNKPMKQWQAQIMIDGKQWCIGYYENEEEAAVDYARAVVKYRGQGALDKAMEQRARDISSERKSIIIDLSDVPPQPSRPKSEGRIKGASKYTGVTFNKPMNKWQAQISIDGKQRLIGYYENEEEAAVDYARAVFKYKGQGALDKARETKEENSSFIDLSNVPPQPPIPKSGGHNKEGASKYTGVTFYKPMNKWKAQIYIDGKQRGIGYYDNEEEAAADYARAVFKYKGQGALDKAREHRARNKAREQNSFIIDLSDVPPQPSIPKSSGRVRDGASKYRGVSFNKSMNKWQALIMIDGKVRCIGSYDNEEEAAVNYARAVFKYKGKGALDKTREQNSIIDLSDVPPQRPLPKRAGYIKEGTSKYAGVTFEKQKNKWKSQIMVDGKQRLIGRYESEEEAAVDYARAVVKFKGQGALDKAREAQEENSFALDLSDVPPQPPIPKSAGRIKEGASKYTGVFFDKQMNKWTAQISIEGKQRHIGYYENEEEAAIDFARAAFKYKEKRKIGKIRRFVPTKNSIV